VGVSRDCQIFEVPPIISGTGKATNFKFGTYIHSVLPNRSSLKIWEKTAWAYPGTAQIFRVPPIISGTLKATNFKFGMVCSQGPSEQKSLKNLGEKGAWVYPVTAQIF